MSYISDFKGAPFSLFGSRGGVTSNDASLATMVGQKFRSADGRRFVLVQNGVAAIASGRLVQGPARIGANHTGLAVIGLAPANPIGATTIKVTLGGTVTTKNQYQGGYAVVSAGTGIGQTLRIAGNDAATASGTCTLTLEDPLSVALTSADSKITLELNPYGSPNGTAYTTHGVIISPSGGTTGPSIGVTLYPIPASTATALSYGFIQCHGLVACLNDSVTAIGKDVMPSSSVDGAVVTYDAAVRNRVGTSTVAGEDQKCQLIDIQL